MHSVLFLVLDFLFVAALYVMLGAQFLAVIQILVYAGGIVVLYLFVVMLVNLKRPPEAHEDPHGAASSDSGCRRRCSSSSRAISAYGYVAPAPRGGRGAVDARSTATPRRSGWLLYTSYLIPFEIASMLLLVAMIGAIVLAKREL